MLLPWHVQNCGLIWLLVIVSEEYFFIFHSWAHEIFAKWVPGPATAELHSRRIGVHTVHKFLQERQSISYTECCRYSFHVNVNEKIFVVFCIRNLSEMFLTIIFYGIYMAVCYQPSHFTLMIVGLFILYLIIIKSEIGFIKHCSGIGHETMKCDGC